MLILLQSGLHHNFSSREKLHQQWLFGPLLILCKSEESLILQGPSLLKFLRLANEMVFHLLL